jgi:hypothetical protein
MKTRSDPAMLRTLARMASFEVGLNDMFRRELVRQLEDAAKDIECMAEDLEMEREMMREMAHDIALSRPPKALKP